MIRCQVGIKTLRLRLYGMRRAQGHGPTEPVAGRGREASCRELEKVSRCSQQFDLVSSGTEVGFGARLARERAFHPSLSAGTVPTLTKRWTAVSAGEPRARPITSAVTWRVRSSEERTRTEGNLMTRLESRRTKSFFFLFFFFGFFLRTEDNRDLDK
jgi:hypothetical protein